MNLGKTWATPPTEPTPIAADAKEVIAAKMAEIRAKKQAARDVRNEGMPERLAKTKAAKKLQNEANSARRDWQSQLPESATSRS